MGKDREGKFHPKKGKPPGKGNDRLGLQPSITPEEPGQDLEMTGKYTSGEDELPDNMRLLHPETPVPPNPILNEKAAEYLRESGNIEDVPNASEQEEADKAINDNNRQ